MVAASAAHGSVRFHEMGRLEGKCALITGAARGIGKAFAQRYVEEGARLAIADINIALAEKSAQEMGGGDQVIAVHLDVSKQESIDAAIQQVITRFGRIDILINCAAIFDMAPIVEISRESFERVFAVNVAGPLFMIQAVAKQMIAQGTGGKIINIVSQAGRVGDPFYVVYCASKAALISLTQSAGLDLIKHGINVNAIAPGYVDTDMFDTVDALFAKNENRPIGEKKRQLGDSVPFGRLGTPQDLCGMAVFLASNDSDYVVPNNSM